MKRILLGIVTTSIEKDFLDSYSKLLVANNRYDITPRIIWNHPPTNGFNMLAEECIREKYDYLFLVGRHYSGFNYNMLVDMVKADSDVATVRYRYYGFPFTHLPMNHERKVDPKCERCRENPDHIAFHLLAISEKKGNHEVKYAGLDFCLIKRSILEKLSMPWFRGDSGNNLIMRLHFDFSTRVREAGGKIVACLDHYIPHDIASDNIEENIKEVYRYMESKKQTREDVIDNGKKKRAEYDRMLKEQLTDIPVHILTPCSRPQNIRMINESIYKAQGPHKLCLNWHIMYKNHDNKYNIIPNYNRYLDCINFGWFTFMCDDNMFHPQLFKAFSETLDKHPDMGVYVVGIMGYAGAVQEAGPQYCKPFNSDAAQYFFKREILGDIRFDTGEMAHGADGQLLKNLYAAHPEKFVFDNRVIAYHEALKTDGWRDVECFETNNKRKTIKESLKRS